MVSDVLAGSCDETRTDRLGNVIGFKKASATPEGAQRPLRVVLAAHADEIGMMVKHISSGGLHQVRSRSADSTGPRSCPSR